MFVREGGVEGCAGRDLFSCESASMDFSIYSILSWGQGHHASLSLFFSRASVGLKEVCMGGGGQGEWNIFLIGVPNVWCLLLFSPSVIPRRHPRR